MKLRIVVFIFFLFYRQILFADSLSVVKKIDIAILFFTTDHLGNSYLVNENGLFKYDKDGNLTASFTAKIFGQIQFIDATDPLKVLVFNKDFALVNTLDSKLSIQTQFNLRDLPVQQPALICTSRHDGYWVFDKQTNQLKKYNSSLQLMFESNDISQLIAAEINPVFLIESEKWLWLNNPSSGILVFDSYGTYLKTLDKSDTYSVNDFQADDDRIVFSEGNSIREINHTKLLSKEITYPHVGDVIKMRIEQNRLYIQKKDVFEIYAF
ncbi:MAG: hypothetical protein ACHQNT_02135 [Bacteroidia bacterium]